MSLVALAAVADDHGVTHSYDSFAMPLGPSPVNIIGCWQSAGQRRQTLTGSTPITCFWCLLNIRNVAPDKPPMIDGK